jgi:hypothetical protein
MKALAAKYGWEVAALGCAWFVESLLNIASTIAGWLL